LRVWGLPSAAIAVAGLQVNGFRYVRSPGPDPETPQPETIAPGQLQLAPHSGGLFGMLFASAARSIRGSEHNVCHNSGLILRK
jgi:hypothetical protein